jgi:hypothetical protein
VGEIKNILRIKYVNILLSHNILYNINKTNKYKIKYKKKKSIKYKTHKFYIKKDIKNFITQKIIEVIFYDFFFFFYKKIDYISLVYYDGQSKRLYVICYITYMYDVWKLIAHVLYVDWNLIS